VGGLAQAERVLTRRILPVRRGEEKKQWKERLAVVDAHLCPLMDNFVLCLAL